VGGDLFFFKASRNEGFGSLFIELISPPGGDRRRTPTPRRSCSTYSRESSNWSRRDRKG
jgi:hypothetical protein